MMQYRRFGKTELKMPVLTCGGMRFQHGFQEDAKIPKSSQCNVEASLRRALELGMNHIETARGYGTSEYQIGRVLPSLKRDSYLLQTKINPSKDPKKFADTFEHSMKLLQADYLDLMSFHGINNDECLEATMCCLDLALQWKKEGRIRHIGFATHGPTETIIEAIQTGAFEYVNLHWFYIFQANWPAILEAEKRDMGVFIISPNDKSGMLYQPSEKLANLCKPIHPMVFNGLFCLSRPQVHTLSIGASRPEEYDIHMETVEKLDQAQTLIMPIIARLESAMREALGAEWLRTWHVGLPEWHETPGEINIPWILRLRNLALAYDMVEFGKMRYNLLGNGGHWFPGRQATDAQQHDLSHCLRNSPHAGKIPAMLAETHALLSGDPVKRLQEE